MKKFLKNYWFILCMLTGIVGGCLVGAFAPEFGGKIEFLGTLFINMMFCVVVPMVFCSIASAIANMKSVKRAGKIMGVTIATFLVTAATIRGRMARRLSSSAKSGFVKKFTIMSPKPSASPTSPSTMV